MLVGLVYQVKWVRLAGLVLLTSEVEWMAYCPRCKAEYSDEVRECLECRVPLRSGHRPVRVGPDVEEILVPIGSFFCLLFAAAMLALGVLARQGQLAEPYSSIVLSTQPTCLTAFYAVAVVLSAGTLGYWLLRRLTQPHE
jgi:hypothetical protein